MRLQYPAITALECRFRIISLTIDSERFHSRNLTLDLRTRMTSNPRLIINMAAGRRQIWEFLHAITRVPFWLNWFPMEMLTRPSGSWGKHWAANALTLRNRFVKKARNLLQQSTTIYDNHGGEGEHRQSLLLPVKFPNSTCVGAHNSRV